MVKITRYLEETQEGGAGGIIDPLNAPKSGVTEPKDDITAATETAELESLLGKADTELSADEKVKLTTLKAKYDVAEVKEDGTPLTKEEKEAAEKTSKRLTEIKAKLENQRTLEESKFLDDNTEKDINVYEQVDELSGMPVKVEYGNIKPNSPEGILMREETIRAQAQQDWDNVIKEKHPLAYQMMLHQQAGGKPEDFLRTNIDDFSAVTLTKADLAMQESVLRKALGLKGLDQDTVNLIVTTAKDKGKLFEQSKKELDILQANQEQEEAERTRLANQSKQREQQLQNSFWTSFDQTLEKGIQGVVIPKGERKAFEDFVAANIYPVNGKLVFNKIIDPANLSEELASHYFRFKKADLSKVVLNKAKDLNTTKFRNNIKYKITPKSSTGANKNFVPIGEL